MRIAAHYSHLNGLEYLLVHQLGIWEEIQGIIASVDGAACKTKVSKEKTMKGKLLYSPKDMNTAMKTGFDHHGWQESRVSYWVTENANLIRKTMHMTADAKSRAADFGVIRTLRRK